MDYVDKRFGTDEKNWLHGVAAVFKCRVRNGRLTGFGGMLLEKEISSGKKKCPLDGKCAGEVNTPQPKDTLIAGAVLARKFPEACPLCGLKPLEDDFDR